MKTKFLLLFFLLPALLLISNDRVEATKLFTGNPDFTYQAAVAGPGGVVYQFFVFEGNLFVQAYDSSGNPLWGEHGKLVSRKGQWELKPHAVPDGQGGAIVVWYVMMRGEKFVTYYRIFAQHIDQNGNLLWNPDGVLDIDQNGNLLWNPDGVLVTEFVIYGAIANSISLVPDDEGGVYILFDLYQDRWTYPSPNNKIYMQRLNSEGQRMFGSDGIQIGPPGGITQFQDSWHAADIDGAGGFITAWIDSRYGAPAVIAQRYNKQGEALWAEPGILACAPTTGLRYFPVVKEDGSGGAVIAWRDKRENTGQEYAVYAQKVTNSGDVLWNEEGNFVGIATASFNMFGWVYNWPRKFDIITDGYGGAIFSWYGKEGIFTQRLNADGSQLWASGGKQITPYWTWPSCWQLVTGMSEGKYLITWIDANGVYARIFDKDGIFNPADDPIIVSQGLGFYSDSNSYWDRYAFGGSIPVYNGSGVTILFQAGQRWRYAHIYAGVVSEDGTVCGLSSE